MEDQITRHIASDAPRVLVVDGSKVTRMMIEQVLRQQLPSAVVTCCENGAAATRALDKGLVDLITTALDLPDMDGIALARHVRENSPQAYIPIVVISGNVQERLESAGMTGDVTDYFDKALGFRALAEFISGYVAPVERAEGRVLYLEDSRVVAMATRRMLEKYGFSVQHVTTVRDAVAAIDAARAEGTSVADIVLTDVYLKDGENGRDLLDKLRGEYGYARGDLPVLVMTADDNPANQSALLKAGANDLVHKPVEERLLVTKLSFQLRVARGRHKSH